MLVKQVPGLGQESFEDDLDDATLRRLQEIAESMAEMSETLTETAGPWALSSHRRRGSWSTARSRAVGQKLQGSGTGMPC